MMGMGHHRSRAQLGGAWRSAGSGEFTALARVPIDAIGRPVFLVRPALAARPEVPSHSLLPSAVIGSGGMPGFLGAQPQARILR
ncbi:hypothetical protein BRAS3809_4640003 [Bradyrhizobium sp. STM 3809]|nr:hypothetical protein BRAS3809_4640003 [Bradyrhizobium sp. STM 3809]